MPAQKPTSFMHHVETVRSLLGLPCNLRIGQVISKGYQIVGWSLDGNLVEAASRLYEELAEPASVNVSNTTMLAGQPVGDDDASQHVPESGVAGPPDCNHSGSPLDIEGMSDDDFEQGSLRPVLSVNKYGSTGMHSISPAPAPPLSPVHHMLRGTPSSIVPSGCHASKLQGKRFHKR